MANAEKKTITIETVNLELTDTEAATLMSILGRLAGDCYEGPRRYLDPIWTALRDAGVESGQPIKISMSDFGNPGVEWHRNG